MAVTLEKLTFAAGAIGPTLDELPPEAPVVIEFEVGQFLPVQSMRSEEIDGEWCFVISSFEDDGEAIGAAMADMLAEVSENRTRIADDDVSLDQIW